MSPDEPGAILMLVNENRVFINQNDHTWLVLHKTASGGTAQNIATFFANDPAMASTHYIIGQDGTVVQAVLEKDGAGGNCCLETGHASYLPLGINLNVKTVSIEHVDPASDNSTPLTDAQRAASFKLVHDICQRHNIPMRPGDASGGIIGHHDIAPLSRARCPGNYPWSDLFTYLQSGGGTSIPPSQGELPLLQLTDPMGQFYTEHAPDRWHCNPTGVDLAYGHLTFYRTYGGIFGLVRTNEIYLAQLPGTAIVVYERAIAIYDPGRKNDNPPGAGQVYLMHIDSGIGQQLIAKPLLAALQAQVSQLQAQLAQDTSAELQAQLASYQAAVKQVDALMHPLAVG